MPQKRNSKLTRRFEDALRYATRVHRYQSRKGTEIPYVSHLLAVASLVLEDGGDEDQVIAALLHDVIEDQGGKRRLRDIRRRFGDRVARIVESCTDTDQTPKPPWRPRKERYIEHIRHAPLDVRRVSLADKLHNARSILRDFRLIGNRLWARFSSTSEDILWYYKSLAKAFRESKKDAMADELARVVRELEREVNRSRRRVR